ncbi:MAG: T9SS type A sorting domain-containing protein [Flavobacteriales bacterium]|nr:T9SS type A sorting domain-containing protein [Flavobacteriales bacterium]
MKKTLLSISAIVGLSFGSMAQTFSPAAGSPLANGEVGTAYSQTINAAIPATVNLTGQQLLDLLPASVSGILGSFITASQSYPVSVTSTTLSVVGLAGGLNEDCGGCLINAGAARDIVLSGTPTAAGSFVVDITSETIGSVSISTPLGAQTVPFGGSFQGQQVPTLPGLMNAEGYTMSVGSSGISESNSVFSLGLYPNPTEGISMLDVNSTVAGMATIEVYSITGALVQASSKSIRVGANRLNVDLTSIPAGIYMVKAVINGRQALVRTQKI